MTRLKPISSTSAAGLKQHVSNNAAGASKPPSSSKGVLPNLADLLQPQDFHKPLEVSRLVILRQLSSSQNGVVDQDIVESIDLVQGQASTIDLNKPAIKQLYEDWQTQVFDAI